MGGLIGWRVTAGAIEGCGARLDAGLRLASERSETSVLMGVLQLGQQSPAAHTSSASLQWWHWVQRRTWWLFSIMGRGQAA
jgi:hypothetical protein